MNFQNDILLISKFNKFNINQHSFLKKIRLSITTEDSVKFSFKNIIWLYLTVFGVKPGFTKLQLKRKTSSKTNLNNLVLDTTRTRFFILYKIITILLPNLENRIVFTSTIKNNPVLTFKNCLTHSETDQILKKKSDMLVKKYNINITMIFKNNHNLENLFNMRFWQLPIKNV